MAAAADAYTLIYESDSVVATANLRATRSVIAGFSAMREGTKVARFGDGVVQKLGHSGVFITAKADHWWQIADRNALCDAVRPVIAPYVEGVAYGSSMGGYGALSLGADMGCKRVIAVAPQTVLSDPAVPLYHRWSMLLHGRQLLRDDVPTDLRGVTPEIVYDPFQDLDRAHVRYLAAKRPVIEVRLPFAGHKVLRTLSECGVLEDVTRRLLAGCYENLALEYRSYRKRSPNCLFSVGVSYCYRGRWEQALKVAGELVRRDEAKLANNLKAIVTQWRPTAERL